MGLIDKIRNALSGEAETSKDDPEVKEVLFINESRVESYFEQISDPITYDKVPEWEAKGSITDVGATHRIRQSGREFTREEKISVFIDLLQENELLSTHRPFQTFVHGERKEEQRYFRLEEMTAKRGHVPTPDDDERFSDLWVWASESPLSSIEDIQEEVGLSPGTPDSPTSQSERRHEVAPLILIEETQQPGNKLRCFTGCSTLEILLSEPTLSETLDGMPVVKLTKKIHWEETLTRRTMYSLISLLSGRNSGGLKES